MTRERREEVVLVALVVSVAVHVGLMWFVRSQVMTRPAAAMRTRDRTAPMRVSRAKERPDPVRIDEILDLKAAKDAPAAVPERSAPRADDPVSTVAAAAKVPDAELPEVAAPVAATPVFDVKTVGRESAHPVPETLTRIETPAATGAFLPAPEFSVRMPSAAKAVAPALGDAVGSGPDSAGLPPARIASRADESSVAFKPAEEIYTKVDERVVAEEKAAVRELVNAESAADLVKFANVTMTSAAADGWRYFKVMVSPRASLKVVPKDVVMVIDGSGSIGDDRLGSCRRAARQILRTCTNTGDRFNLVVFRNAFSYAFRAWQPCEAASFAAGDKWLGRQTAHGRTDVFGTISSLLTLPRDPKRPIVALVVTDGDANAGVSDTAEILSKFTALNDGLVSVYMYGVKSSANRELIDVLTRGNRGESFVFDGWRWNAGDGLEGLSERFRDPVLSDLRVVFAAGTKAEAYPRLLRNLVRGGTVEFYGRVPQGCGDVAFSLRGLSGETAYEGFFRLPFASAPNDPSVIAAWRGEAAIDRKLR